MRSRLLIIAISILVIIGIALAIFARFMSGPTTIETVETPTLPVIQDTDQEGIIFSTRKGVVRTKDFYAAAVASSSNEVTLFDQPGTGVIYFDPKTKSFNILAAAQEVESFRVQRPLLETTPLDILGVSKEDACKLSVFLNATAPDDESLGTADFGLSFCVNAIPTP